MSESKIVNECKKAAALSSHWNGEMVSTPYTLAVEMVSKIPEDIIMNPESKFLDPCAGIGTFGAALLERLVEYHSEEHIINEMIHLVEISALKVILLKKVGFKNVEKADSLKKEWNMKFDVVIGNPPYNDDDTKQKDSQHRKGSNLAKVFLDLFPTLLKPGGFFNVVLPVSRTVTDATLNKFSAKGKTVVTNATESFKKVKLGKIVTFLFDSAAEPSLVNNIVTREKAANGLDKLMVSPTVVDTKIGYSRATLEAVLDDEGDIEVMVSTSVSKYTNDQSIADSVKDVSFGSWRVAIPGIASMKSIGKVRVIGPDVVAFGTSKVFPTNSEESANKLADYLNSKEVADILSDVRTSVSNSKKFFEYVPNPLVD